MIAFCKRLVALCCFLLGSICVFSQNLVRNPYMNDSANPATDFNQIKHAEGWSSATKGTVDLFGNKGSKGKNGIPHNRQGYQKPLVGNNYAGIIAYWDPKERKAYSEYLQGEFIEPLKANQLYVFSFYISLSERSTRSVRSLGVSLHPELVKKRHKKHLKMLPKFDHPIFLEDKREWTKVEHQFRAEGGERYFVIGKFGDPASIVEDARIVAPSLRKKENRAYYYICCVYTGCVTLDSAQLSSRYMEERAKDVFDLASYGIQFEHDKDQLLPTSFSVLQELVELMEQYPDMQLRIEGHTDGAGDKNHNQVLSQKRAEVVCGYLVSKGISASRMLPLGMGQAFPIAENSNEIGKAKNRRVVFKINF